MISNDTLKRYKEAKKKLRELNKEMRNIEEEISKEVFKNFISNNYKIKNAQVSLSNHICEPDIITVFYPELEVPKGFEKKDEEIDGYSKNFGVGDIIKEYKLIDKKNDIIIRIKEESYKAQMIPRDTVIDKEKRYCSMIWINYIVKIKGKQFIFTRDYEKDFIELPK